MKVKVIYDTHASEKKKMSARNMWRTRHWYWNI